VLPPGTMSAPRAMAPIAREAVDAAMDDWHLNFLRELASRRMARVPPHPSIRSSRLSVSATTLEDALSKMVEGHASSALGFPSGGIEPTLGAVDQQVVVRLLLDMQRWLAELFD